MKFNCVKTSLVHILKRPKRAGRFADKIEDGEQHRNDSKKQAST